MSRADVDRLVVDLRANRPLAEEIAKGAGGLRSVVDIANRRGYQITIDEARQYMREKASNLTDAELDALAGGKGSPPPSGTATQVSTVQTVASVTTVATTAEVAETAGAVTSVAVVAEGVIVAT
jgi:hypothetical protein